jgi:hypothetical protein
MKDDITHERLPSGFEELFNQLFPEVKFVDCKPNPDDEEAEEE